MRKTASYADVLAAPEHKIAEIVDGALMLSPRPGGAQAEAVAALVGQLVGPFWGPGGGPRKPGGWRLERMPQRSEAPWIELAPDWLCEVVSPSTARHDRMRKLPIYARQGVLHVWLVDPLLETVEVLELRDGAYSIVQTAEGREKRAKLRPFDAVGLDLRRWWGLG
ncbi:MAG: Uma2 family endonuclease [Deltaproteobacteria bacterium]|nr:Uma2 family endonuclease [Deltaproteobacteria bacterium]